MLSPQLDGDMLCFSGRSEDFTSLNCMASLERSVPKDTGFQVWDPHDTTVWDLSCATSSRGTQLPGPSVGAHPPMGLLGGPDSSCLGSDPLPSLRSGLRKC